MRDTHTTHPSESTGGYRPPLRRMAVRFGLILSALMMWVVFAGNTFAWVQLTVSGECSPNGHDMIWTV